MTTKTTNGSALSAVKPGLMNGLGMMDILAERIRKEHLEREILHKVMDTDHGTQGVILERLRSIHFTNPEYVTLFQYVAELYTLNKSISADNVQNMVTMRAKPQEYQSLIMALSEVMQEPLSSESPDNIIEELDVTYKQRTVYNEVFLMANRMFMQNEPFEAVVEHISNAIMKMDTNTHEVTLPQAVDQAEQMVFRPEQGDRGLLIGLSDWDQQFGGIKRDRVYTIGGYTGSGKTAKMIDLIGRLCIRHHYHLDPDTGKPNTDGAEKIAIQFFSLEMSEVRIVFRLTSWLAGITEHVLTNQGVFKPNGDPLVHQLDPIETDRVLKAMAAIKKWPLEIVYTSLSSSSIRTKGKKFALKNKGKHLIYILDHIGEVEKTTVDNRIEFDKVMDACKSFARDHKGSVFPLIQLEKATEKGPDAEKRFYRPGKGNVMESVGVEAKSDVLILCWRPAKKWKEIAYDGNPKWSCVGKIIDIVEKNRDGLSFNDIVYACDIQYNRIRDNAEF
jgi:replicative DNA helicase